MANIDLIDSETKIKVSSTLDKSVGKKFLTDGSPETCWTSSQGLPQSIQLTFPSLVRPSAISITFQGGFVGKRCSLYAGAPSFQSQQWALLERFFPEDVNRRQTFSILRSDTPGEGADCQEVNDSEPARSTWVDRLKLVFEESTDFFGRITIYDLRVVGERVEN